MMIRKVRAWIPKHIVIDPTKKITLLCVLLNCAYTFANAQQSKDHWLSRQAKRIFNDTTSASNPTLSIYPTLGFAPETGIEMGASILKLYRANNDTTKRLSELQAFAFVTFKAQYGMLLDNAVYADEDRWFFLGRTKIQRFPILYYGIGPATGSPQHATVDAFNVTFKQRVLRKVMENIFLGPEVDFQNLSDVHFRLPSDGDPELPAGSQGSTSFGFGGSIVFDNRHNVLNVRKGLYSEISYLHYRSSLGRKFSFNSINIDLRSFYPVSRNNVLAWQLSGIFQSGDIPFNQLAQMGGDMIMRGYYQGRYRDKNMIAAQTEFRMLPFAFHKRLGGSVFAGSAVVAPSLNKFALQNLRFTGGLGLRYLLFPKKDIYLRLDIGFSKEGSNFYVLNGEAF